MKKALSDELLARLSEFVAARMALHFPRARWADLERMANSAFGEMGYADPESFIEGLISSPVTMERMEILACHLSIGETFFWREPQVFDALEGRILPELIRSRESGERRLRIWCAGCSTGEEAYSIAVALRRVLGAIDEWNITILATDINPRMLRKAKAGLFGDWSFRNAPPWLTEGFFRAKKDGKREILPEIGKMISFAYLNLADDMYPASLNNTNAMDIIFCRNVLMYFSPERARQIVGGLRRALVEGGWLFTSACECSQLLFSEFDSVQFPGATGYRRSPDTTRPEETPFREMPGAKAAPREALTMLEPPRPRAPVECRAPRKPGSEAAPPSIAQSVRELADQGRLTEALALCEKAIARDKLEPRLHLLKATILQELNRQDDAIASLKRAIYLDPKAVTAHFTLGNLALRSGDARAGMRCLKNALALLAGRGDEEILSDAEGLTTGRFREIIKATMRIEEALREAV
jgi:chemotaxis protein methyltransferase CheR